MSGAVVRAAVRVPAYVSDGRMDMEVNFSDEELKYLPPVSEYAIICGRLNEMSRSLLADHIRKSTDLEIRQWSGETDCVEVADGRTIVTVGDYRNERMLLLKAVKMQQTGGTFVLGTKDLGTVKTWRDDYLGFSEVDIDEDVFRAEVEMSTDIDIASVMQAERLAVAREQAKSRTVRPPFLRRWLK